MIQRAIVWIIIQFIMFLNDLHVYDDILKDGEQEDLAKDLDVYKALLASGGNTEALITYSFPASAPVSLKAKDSITCLKSYFSTVVTVLEAEGEDDLLQQTPLAVLTKYLAKFTPLDSATFESDSLKILPMTLGGVILLLWRRRTKSDIPSSLVKLLSATSLNLCLTDNTDILSMLDQFEKDLVALRLGAIPVNPELSLIGSHVASAIIGAVLGRISDVAKTQPKQP